MEYDKLIYGKNNLERIVSIEVTDDQIEAFIQGENGQIKSEFFPNRYWMLSNKPHNKRWVKLNGDLHYKYGLQFGTRQDYLRTRAIYNKHDTYSIYDPKESAMVKDGYTYFKGLKPEELSILSFDIESTGIAQNKKSKVLLIANTFRCNGKVQRKMFCYNDYNSCGDMIEDWCKWVREINPSILCGHNIMGYDLPYMHYCAGKTGHTMDLGRDGSNIHFKKYPSKFRIDGSKDLKYNKIKIYGREVIDTMFLAYKYDIGRNYPSYGLKPIIDYEELTKEGRVFYDAATIKDNYKIPEEWEKIKDYAMFDGDDSLALYDLMIPPFFYMTQSVPKPFQLILESASGSQINSMMMRAYLQDMHSLPKADESVKFEGAISKGIPGIYKNVYKIDVASLYPSIMIVYDVFDKVKDPNHHFYHFVKTFTEKRLHHKARKKEAKYHDDMQATYKILINSMYGFMGTPGLLFNSPENAAFVTRKGRELLTQAIDWSEDNGYKLVNCDTDSVSIARIDDEFIEQDERQTITDKVNELSPDGIMWEDDGYYLKFIVVKAKNYVLWDGKKLKQKGSAILATQKEIALKEFINEIIQYILDDKMNELNKLYLRYVKEILEIKDISRWCARKTLSLKTYESTRTNETKIIDAIEGTDYVVGDRVFVYFKPDGSLGLKERFNSDYDVSKLLEKLFKTGDTFKTVLPTNELFINYKLKRNQKLLEDIK